MKQSVIPVVLARMDSRRMPGKVMRPLLDGHSVIDRVIEQVGLIARTVDGIEDPLIATTPRVVDEPIVRASETWGVQAFAGPLLPLLRMRAIAQEREDSWLWRLNADSPLLLEPLIEYAVSKLPELGGSYCAVTNLLARTFPYGVSLELYRADWLGKIDETLFTEAEKEHINSFAEKKYPKAVSIAL